MLCYNLQVTHSGLKVADDSPDELTQRACQSRCWLAGQRAAGQLHMRLATARGTSKQGAIRVHGGVRWRARGEPAGASYERRPNPGTCMHPYAWILSGAAAELVQCSNFIPNKESEKLLQIRTGLLIGCDRNPTIPRARIPDDRLLFKTQYRTASRTSIY